MNTYLKKDWITKINRVQDTNPERMNTDPPEVRLHRAERLLDFPENMFNSFINEITQEDIRLYPETNILKNKIAKHYNIDDNNILLFAGSLVGIKTFTELFCTSDKSILLSKACYPMHFLFPQMQNSNIKYIEHITEETSNNNILKLKLDFDEFIKNINSELSCICIANPNSPNGDILNINQIEIILMKAKQFTIPVLIDEAYIEFSEVETSINLLQKYDNLAISRTFSKAFGCAGLRCGYICTSINISNSMKKIMYPHEITHVTTKFCSMLLDNMNITYDYTNSIKNERKAIFDICYKNNIKYLDCQLNTIHIKLNNIDKIYEYLINNNVRCKCRNINNEKYLCISLFPSLHTSKIFNHILDYHNN